MVLQADPLPTILCALARPWSSGWHDLQFFAPSKILQSWKTVAWNSTSVYKFSAFKASRFPSCPLPPYSSVPSSSTRRPILTTGRRRSTSVSASVNRSVRQDAQSVSGTTDTFTLRLLVLSPLLIVALLLLATLWLQPLLARDTATSVDDIALAQIYEKVDALNQDTAKILEIHLAEYKKEIDSSNEHNTERLLTRLNDELVTVSLETSRFLREQRSQLGDEVNTLFDKALKGLHTKYDEEIAALDRQFTRQIQNSRSEHKDELATLARNINGRRQAQRSQQLAICHQSADVTKFGVSENYVVAKERCSKAMSYEEEYELIGKVLNDSQSVFDGWLESRYRNELWIFERDYRKLHHEVAFNAEHLRIYANLGSESLSNAIPSIASDIEASLLVYKDRLIKILAQAQYAIEVTELLLSMKDETITMIKQRDERLNPRRYAYQYTCLGEQDDDIEHSAACKGLDELYAVTDCFGARYVSRRDWAKDVWQSADKAINVLEYTLNDLTKYGHSSDSLTTETIRQLTEPFARAMQTLKEKMESSP